MHEEVIKLLEEMRDLGQHLPAYRGVTYAAPMEIIDKILKKIDQALALKEK